MEPSKSISVDPQLCCHSVIGATPAGSQEPGLTSNKVYLLSGIKLSSSCKVSPTPEQLPPRSSFKHSPARRQSRLQQQDQQPEQEEQQQTVSDIQIADVVASNHGMAASTALPQLADKAVEQHQHKKQRVHFADELGQCFQVAGTVHSAVQQQHTMQHQRQQDFTQQVQQAAAQHMRQQPAGRQQCNKHQRRQTGHLLQEPAAQASTIAQQQHHQQRQHQQQQDSGLKRLTAVLGPAAPGLPAFMRKMMLAANVGVCMQNGGSNFRTGVSSANGSSMAESSGFKNSSSCTADGNVHAMAARSGHIDIHRGAWPQLQQQQKAQHWHSLCEQHQQPQDPRHAVAQQQLLHQQPLQQGSQPINRVPDVHFAASVDSGEPGSQPCSVAIQQTQDFVVQSVAETPQQELVAGCTAGIPATAAAVVSEVAPATAMVPDTAWQQKPAAATIAASAEATAAAVLEQDELAKARVPSTSDTGHTVTKAATAAVAEPASLFSAGFTVASAATVGYSTAAAAAALPFVASQDSCPGTNAALLASSSGAAAVVAAEQQHHVGDLIYSNLSDVVNHGCLPHEVTAAMEVQPGSIVPKVLSPSAGVYFAAPTAGHGRPPSSMALSKRSIVRKQLRQRHLVQEQQVQQQLLQRQRHMQQQQESRQQDHQQQQQRRRQQGGQQDHQQQQRQQEHAVMYGHILRQQQQQSLPASAEQPNQQQQQHEQSDVQPDHCYNDMAGAAGVAPVLQLISSCNHAAVGTLSTDKQTVACVAAAVQHAPAARHECKHVCTSAGCKHICGVGSGDVAKQGHLLNQLVDSAVIMAEFQPSTQPAADDSRGAANPTASVSMSPSSGAVAAASQVMHELLAVSHDDIQNAATATAGLYMPDSPPQLHGAAAALCSDAATNTATAIIMKADDPMQAVVPEVSMALPAGQAAEATAGAGQGGCRAPQQHLSSSGNPSQQKQQQQQPLWTSAATPAAAQSSGRGSSQCLSASFIEAALAYAEQLQGPVVPCSHSSGSKTFRLSSKGSSGGRSQQARGVLGSQGATADGADVQHSQPQAAITVVQQPRQQQQDQQQQFQLQQWPPQQEYQQEERQPQQQADTAQAEILSQPHGKQQGFDQEQQQGAAATAATAAAIAAAPMPAIGQKQWTQVSQTQTPLILSPEVADLSFHDPWPRGCPLVCESFPFQRDAIAFAAWCNAAGPAAVAMLQQQCRAHNFGSFQKRQQFLAQFMQRHELQQQQQQQQKQQAQQCQQQQQPHWQQHQQQQQQQQQHGGFATASALNVSAEVQAAVAAAVVAVKESERLRANIPRTAAPLKPAGGPPIDEAAVPAAAAGKGNVAPDFEHAAGADQYPCTEADTKQVPWVRVFTEEYEGRNGYTRRFLAASYAALWRRHVNTPQARRHLYEVIQAGAPCHLYFDLEYSRTAHPGSSGSAEGHTPGGEAANVSGNRLVNILVKIMKEVFSSIWGLSVSNQCILELDSSSPEKFSRHLIIHIPGKAFRDNGVVGNLVRIITSSSEALQHLYLAKDPPAAGARSRGAGQHACFVDGAVYSKNRHFRLVGSCKGGKRAVLQPTLRYAMSAATHNELPVLRHQLFLMSLICNVHPGSRMLELTARPIAFPCFGTQQQQHRQRQQPGHAGSDDQHQECFVQYPEHPAVGPVVKGTGAPAGLEGCYRPIKATWGHCQQQQQPVAQSAAAPTASQAPLNAQVVQNVAIAAVSFVEKVASRAAERQPAQVRTIAYCGRWTPNSRHCAFAYSLLGPGSHMCGNINRNHRHNHVFYVLDFANGAYCQKCHDPDCAGYRSPWTPLPAAVWQRERLMGR